MTRNITKADMEHDGVKTLGQPTTVVFYAGGERSEAEIVIVRGSGGGNPGVKMTYTRPVGEDDADEDNGAEAQTIDPRKAVDERVVSAALNAKARLPRGGKGVIMESGEDADQGALYFYGQLNLASAMALSGALAAALTAKPKASLPNGKRSYGRVVARAA